MVALPQYRPQTELRVPTPPTPPIIPSTYSDAFSNVANMANNILAGIAEQKGAAAGAADQRANPDQAPGFNLDFSAYGKAYDKARREQYSAQKQIQWDDQIAGLEQQHHADPTGFSVAYKQAQEKFLQTMPDPMLPAFSQYTDQTYRRSIDKLNQQAFVRQQQQSLADYETSFGDLKTQAYNAVVRGDDPEKINGMLGQAHTLITSASKLGYLNPIDAQKDVQEFGHVVRIGEIERTFRQQPGLNAKEDFINHVRDASLDELGFRGSPLDPTQRLQLVNRLDAELATDRRQQREALAVEQGTISRLFNDEIAARLQTGKGIGLTSDRIRAAFPEDPLRAQELIGQMTDATRTYTVIQNSAFTNPAQDAVVLAGMLPKITPGNPAANAGYADELHYYRIASQAIAQKQLAVSRDPAGYVLQTSPEARKLMASDDPAQRQAGLAMVDSLQDKMGVPDGQRRLLSNDQASAITASLLNQFGDPNKLADSVQSLAGQFGPYWPRVYAQLAKDKLPETYQLLGIMDQPGDALTRKNYALALQAGDKNLKANLDEHAVQQIRDGVRGGLADFSRTITASGGNDRLVSMMDHGAQTLAMYYANHGMSASDAANAAVKQLTSRWDFGDTYRTPAGMLGRTQDAIGATMGQLRADQMVPVAPREGEVLDEGQRQAVQLDAAKRGHWVTNEDGSGVVLLYPNGEPVMVRPSSPSPQQNFEANKKYLKPGDQTYNTTLSPQEETSFRAWLKANNVPFNPDAKVTDYDMRGFYKALQAGDARAQSAVDPNDGKLHYPDYWKTAYHRTFSNESQWATPNAPRWNDRDQLVDAAGNVLFDDRAPRVVHRLELKFNNLPPAKATFAPLGFEGSYFLDIPQPGQTGMVTQPPTSDEIGAAR